MQLLSFSAQDDLQGTYDATQGCRISLYLYIDIVMVLVLAILLQCEY